MYNMSKKALLIIIGIIGAFAVSAGTYWVLYLEKAHSTFENYADFRNCISTSNRTEASADCLLKSGEIIKLVNINNKWYLEGDGPGIW